MLGVHVAIKFLVKLLSVYKAYPNDVEIKSSLH